MGFWSRLYYRLWMWFKPTQLLLEEDERRERSRLFVDGGFRSVLERVDDVYTEMVRREDPRLGRVDHLVGHLLKDLTSMQNEMRGRTVDIRYELQRIWDVVSQPEKTRTWSFVRKAKIYTWPSHLPSLYQEDLSQFLESEEERSAEEQISEAMEEIADAVPLNTSDSALDLILERIKRLEIIQNGIDSAPSSESLSAAEVRVKSGNLYVRRELALDPNLTTEILTVLARDPEVSVRLRLARRNDLPPEITEILLDDASPLVRRYMKTKGTKSQGGA